MLEPQYYFVVNRIAIVPIDDDTLWHIYNDGAYVEQKLSTGLNQTKSRLPIMSYSNFVSVCSAKVDDSLVFLAISDDDSDNLYSVLYDKDQESFIQSLPQLTKSHVNCGDIVSRNSQPTYIFKKYAHFNM